MDTTKGFFWIVGVLIAGLFIGYSFTGMAVRKNPGGGGGSCLDSDSGQNLFVRGTVSSGSQGSATDACTSSQSVNEYYCYSKNTWSSSNMPCPNGYSCSNGACFVAASTTSTTTSTTSTILPQGCYDSDNGQNLFVAGYGQNKTGTYYDGCSDSTRIHEYYCWNLTSTQQLLTAGSFACPAGTTCSGGACRTV